MTFLGARQVGKTTFAKTLAVDAAEVERSSYMDSRTAVFYARRTLERAAKMIDVVQQINRNAEVA